MAIIKFDAYFADNILRSYLLSANLTGDPSDLESMTYGDKTHRN
jgi:hypothetical protein